MNKSMIESITKLKTNEQEAMKEAINDSKAILKNKESNKCKNYSIKCKESNESIK